MTDCVNFRLPIVLLLEMPLVLTRYFSAIEATLVTTLPGTWGVPPKIAVAVASPHNCIIEGNQRKEVDGGSGGNGCLRGRACWALS